MAFAKYSPLTIDSALVTGTPGAGFRALVSKTDARFKSIANGGNVAQADGGDIAFYAVDGTTQLPHKLLAYNPATGLLVAWVLINCGDSLVIRVYYGDAVLANQTDPEGVFDASSWDFEDGSTLEAVDNSANNADGTITNAVAAAGKVGPGAASFDGTGDFIDVGSGASVLLALPMRITGWLKSSDIDRSGNAQAFFSSGTDNTSIYNGIYFGASGASGGLELSLGDNSGIGAGHRRSKVAGSALTNNVWHKLVAVIRSGTDISLFVDGVDVGGSYSGSGGALAYDGSAVARFGRDMFGFDTPDFLGQLDAWLVEGVDRGADWEVTEYENQNDPDAFWALGSEVSLGNTLSAAQGSYSLTGNAAVLKRALLLAAAAATFALTGQSATLSRSGAATLGANHGTFTLSGQTAALRRSRILSAVFGSFVLSGRNADLINSADSVPAGVNPTIIFTFQPAPYDSELRDVRTLHFANLGFVTKPTDTPADQHFAPRLKQPLSISRNLVAPGRTSGDPRIAYGDVVLDNPDGALDYLAELAFDGRDAIIRRGRKGTDFPADFPTFFVPAMEQPEVGEVVTLKLRDQRYDLSVPLQTNKYAGNNVNGVGLEGTADDLKGKSKPVLLGRVDRVGNISPPCVNVEKNIHQVNDGPVHSIPRVCDMGVDLTEEAEYSSLAELQDDLLAPSASCYRVYPAGGHFRLGSPPVGVITCTARQGSSDAAHTGGQLFVAVLGRAAFVPGDWRASAITALDSVWPAPMGVWVGPGESKTCGDIASLIALSADAWFGPDRDGVIVIEQLPLHLDPDDAVASFNERHLIKNSPSSPTPLQRLAATDDSRGLPVYSVLAKYARNYTVQESGSEIGLPGTLSPPVASITFDDATGFVTAVATNAPGCKSMRITLQENIEPTIEDVRTSTGLANITTNESELTYNSGSPIGVGNPFYVYALGYTELDGSGNETPLGKWSAVRALGTTSVEPLRPVSGNIWGVLNASGQPTVRLTGSSNVQSLKALAVSAAASLASMPTDAAVRAVTALDQRILGATDLTAIALGEYYLVKVLFYSGLGGTGIESEPYELILVRIV